MNTVASHLDGDFAISFVKNNTHTLYQREETNRPCYLAYWEKARVLYYASEVGFLEKAFASAGVECTHYQINTNTLYAFDTRKFDSLATNVDKTDFDTRAENTRYTLTTTISTTIKNTDYTDFIDIDIEFGFFESRCTRRWLCLCIKVMEMMNWGLDTQESIPSRRRDSSDYWNTMDEEEWYFLDPRNGQWYAESMLTPNRWCLVRGYTIMNISSRVANS